MYSSAIFETSVETSKEREVGSIYNRSLNTAWIQKVIQRAYDWGSPWYELVNKLQKVQILFLLSEQEASLASGRLVWGPNAEVVCADNLAYVFWKPGAWEGLEISGLRALPSGMCSLRCPRQVGGWQDFHGEALWCLSEA